MKTRAALPGFFGFLFVAVGAGCGNTGTIDPGADAGVDGSVILDGGGEIPQPPDGASSCPGGACNYQTNAGCTATQSCVPLPDGMGKAPPGCLGAGTGASGTACQNFDQCAPGFLCAAGQCRKLCCGGDWTGCPSDSEHCIQNLAVGDGNGGTIATGAMLCLPVNTCDALDPASCTTAGTSCQIVDPTGATACFKEGAGESGDACPCKGGYLCVGSECRRLCKAVEGGGEPSCEDGEGVCIHYHRDPQGVGECTPKG
jgi:hypothetical protein